MLNKEMLERLNSIFAVESVAPEYVAEPETTPEENIEQILMEAVNDYIASEQELAMETVFFEQSVALACEGLTLDRFHEYSGTLATEAIVDKVKTRAITAKNVLAQLVKAIQKTIVNLFNYRRLQYAKLIKYKKLIDKYLDKLREVKLEAKEYKTTVKVSYAATLPHSSSIVKLLKTCTLFMEKFDKSMEAVQQPTKELQDIQALFDTFSTFSEILDIDLKMDPEKFEAELKTKLEENDKNVKALLDEVAQLGTFSITHSLITDAIKSAEQIKEQIVPVSIKRYLNKMDTTINKHAKLVETLMKNTEGMDPKELKDNNAIIYTQNSVKNMNKLAVLSKDHFTNVYKAYVTIAEILCKDMDRITKAAKKAESKEDK